MSSLPVASWRRLRIPEFDQRIAERDRIGAPHHHRDQAEPRVGMHHSNGAGRVLDHDVGKADGREPRKVLDLGLRFEPKPVRVLALAEVGKGDSYSLHEITGVFRFEGANVFHRVVVDADREHPLRVAHQGEAGHIKAPRSPSVHLGFFPGEHKSRSRGWDADDASNGRNVLALMAVAAMLFAALAWLPVLA